MSDAPQPTAAASPRLILASASPRRQSLLRDAGYELLVHPAEVDEAALAGHLPPADLALRLAVAKAQAVAELFPDDVVLGADTVVALGEVVLGKPVDAEQARAMLTLLEGTTQIVVTGVAVLRRRPAFSSSRRVFSAVQMKPLTPGQIDEYVASNQWRGKAGGYGIQDPDPFVARLAGCHSNIVGLPMTTTRQLLQLAGIGPRAK